MTEVYVKPYQALHEAHLLIVMLELWVLLMILKFKKYNNTFHLHCYSLFGLKDIRTYFIIHTIQLKSVWVCSLLYIPMQLVWLKSEEFQWRGLHLLPLEVFHVWTHVDRHVVCFVFLFFFFSLLFFSWCPF